MNYELSIDRMGIEKGIFQRTQLLLGKSFIEKASEKRVIIFGIGGVGIIDVKGKQIEIVNKKSLKLISQNG